MVPCQEQLDVGYSILKDKGTPFQLRTEVRTSRQAWSGDMELGIKISFSEAINRALN